MAQHAAEKIYGTEAAVVRLLPPPPAPDQTSTVSTADLGSTLNSELTAWPDVPSPSSTQFSRSGCRSVLSVEDHISDALEHHSEVATLLPRALLQVCTNSRHRVCLQLLWSKPGMFETYVLQMADVRRVPVASINDKRAVLLAFNDISKSGGKLQRDRVDNVLVILFELEGWAEASRTFAFSDLSGGSLGAYLRRARNTATASMRSLPAPPAAGPVAICPPPNLPVPPAPDTSSQDTLQGQAALHNSWTMPSVEDKIFETLESQPGAEVLIPRALVEVAVSPESRSALELLRTSPHWFKNYTFKLLDLRKPLQMTIVLDQDAKLEGYFEDLARPHPSFCNQLSECWRATKQFCSSQWSQFCEPQSLFVIEEPPVAQGGIAASGIQATSHFASPRASAVPDRNVRGGDVCKFQVAGLQRPELDIERSGRLSWLGSAPSVLTKGFLSHLLCDCISSWWRGAIDGRTCCKLLTTRLASAGVSHATGVALVCMVCCGPERAVAQAYRTLGVVLSVPHGRVREAYLQLAHRYHPAAKHGDIDIFIKVNVAYEVIRADRVAQTIRGKR